MWLDGDEIVEVLLLGPGTDGPRPPPTMKEEIYSWGMNWSPRRFRQILYPPWRPEVPKPEEPHKWSDTPNLPSPLSMASNSHSNWFWNTRRAWHWARPQYLLTPNPACPYNWILAYVEEKEELLSWWWEFGSLCHKSTKPLCNAQVKELARKQAAAFRLPTARKKNSAGGAPLLAWLAWGCLDFLPLSSPMIQGPWDIHIVRRDETVALAWTLQWWAIQSGSPLGILCGRVQDLHRCLMPLIEKDYLIDTSMLEVVEAEPMTSLNPVQEARQWGAEPGPPEEQATTHISPTDLKRFQSLRELSVQG